MDKAIPTVGPRGIMFRSRLEAQWAYIFEIFKWNYVYEPYDLNGYIPDFILKMGDKEILVEIKGVLDIWEEEVHEPYVKKIIKSGWKKDFIILGANYIKDVIHEDTVVGCCPLTFTEPHEEEREELKSCQAELRFALSTYNIWFLRHGCKYVLTKNGGGWKDRHRKTHNRFEKIWAYAKNITQWKGIEYGNFDKKRFNFKPPYHFIEYSSDSDSDSDSK